MRVGVRKFQVKLSLLLYLLEVGEQQYSLFESLIYYLYKDRIPKESHESTTDLLVCAAGDSYVFLSHK